jgi:hypothetical protein
MDFVVLIAMLAVGFLLGFYARDRIDARRYVLIRRDGIPKIEQLLAVARRIVGRVIAKARTFTSS